MALELAEMSRCHLYLLQEGDDLQHLRDWGHLSPTGISCLSANLETILKRECVGDMFSEEKSRSAASLTIFP